MLGCNALHACLRHQGCPELSFMQRTMQNILSRDIFKFDTYMCSDDCIDSINCIFQMILLIHDCTFRGLIDLVLNNDDD